MRNTRSSHPSWHRSISPRRENNRLANSSHGHSGQQDYEGSDDMAIAIDRSHENEVFDDLSQPNVRGQPGYSPVLGFINVLIDRKLLLFNLPNALDSRELFPFRFPH